MATAHLILKMGVKSCWLKHRTLDLRSGAQGSGHAGDGFQPQLSSVVTCPVVFQPWNRIGCLGVSKRSMDCSEVFEFTGAPATNSHLSTHPGPFGQCPVSGTPMVQLKCEVAHQTPQQNVCSWTCRPDRKSHKQKQNRTKRYIQCDWIPAPWEKKIKHNQSSNQRKTSCLKKERHLKLSSGWETQFAVPQFPSPNSMPNN